MAKGPKKTALKKIGSGSIVKVRPGRPEAGYLAVVDARQYADDATEALMAACTAKCKAAHELVDTTEVAMIDLVKASRVLV